MKADKMRMLMKNMVAHRLVAIPPKADEEAHAQYKREEEERQAERRKQRHTGAFGSGPRIVIGVRRYVLSCRVSG